MGHFFSHFIPKQLRTSFREYILSLIRSEKESQQGNLQLHVDNLAQLLTSTTNNLENVGASLASIHQSLNAEVATVKKNQELISKQLTQLEISNLILYRQLAEVIEIDELCQQKIREFVTQYGVDFDFNQEVSKNDIMFLYSLDTYRDMSIAFHNYFTIGYNGFSLIKDFLSNVFPDQTFKGKILDFASGYGRVTRFLSAYYGPSQVTTSDIKTEAVDFQIKHFQVDGFYSTYTPSTLKVEKRFDLIFVGSLFSHLDESLFQEWLTTLISLLTENGFLLFTVHDQTLHPDLKEESFQFVASNEDEKFEFIQNRITSTSLYGISFVSEFYVSQVLKKVNPNLAYKRYPKTFGGHQDLYIATLNGKLPNDDFKF